MNKIRNRTSILSLSAVILLGLTFVACASTKKAALKHASAESMQSFARGDYAKAIELHQSLYEREPGNAKILAGYVAIVEEVKRAGDRSRAQGSHAAAEPAYRALLDSWDGITGIKWKLSFKRVDVEAGLRECWVASCERQFRQELRAGAFAKALEIYQAALREYPGDKALRAGYARGVGEIRAIVAKALAAKDYALAGKINGLLLTNIVTFEKLGAQAQNGGSDRRRLTETLQLCASGLTNRGLDEYRKGNLEKAIVLWGDLLAFDPGNAEIRKAVDTAKAQLVKLKGTSPGSN